MTGSGQPMQPVDQLCLLFIDDDPFLLQALNRTIHIRYPRWRLLFAASPLDAFRILQAQASSIQVVVCDLHLPYLSGVKILRLIKTEFPAIVRLTLSDRLDGPSLRGSDEHSECHVCKPVHVNHLCEKIILTYAARHAAIPHGETAS